jgi:hypothetical protein
LSLRRRGRRIGSTNSHCSSVSSQRPAIQVRRDALSISSLAEIRPENVYEMGSRLVLSKPTVKRKSSEQYSL